MPAAGVRLPALAMGASDLWCQMLQPVGSLTPSHWGGNGVCPRNHLQRKLHVSGMRLSEGLSTSGSINHGSQPVCWMPAAEVSVPSSTWEFTWLACGFAGKLQAEPASTRLSGR